MQKKNLIKLLTKHKGNMSLSAEEIGVHPVTIRRRMREHGLKKEDFKSARSRRRQVLRLRKRYGVESWDDVSPELRVLLGPGGWRPRRPTVEEQGSKPS